MKGCEAIGVTGIDDSAGQHKELLYEAVQTALHCKVEGGKPLLHAAAAGIQDPAHHLHMALIGCQLGSREVLIVLAAKAE